MHSCSFGHGLQDGCVHAGERQYSYNVAVGSMLLRDVNRGTAPVAVCNQTRRVANNNTTVVLLAVLQRARKSTVILKNI